MKLSVVIVNYNVRHFLEQCLHSVMGALRGLEAEVLVVDNASIDGSCRMVREKFPQVLLTANPDNRGFSKANNQAIRQSSGEYVLLLNPDTVVEEDTFTRALEFMDAHPEAGGLGVRMIDGKGRFLPESKRGLPTPWVAFYKISGLSALFPRSKRLGRYHLTYLDPAQTHAVDILCGAFMLLRKSVLDKTGLLDETFFMYGEDIDLSYRILQQGYKNYYFPETTIIHYKGESTRKESLNYVKLFYQAMAIFAGKHFSSGNARVFTLLINAAIWFRALVAVLRRGVQKVFLPVLDGLLIYGGFALILPVWERFRFEPGYYPSVYMRWVVPVYILFWLLGILVSGGYRRKVSLYRVVRGLLWGSIGLLIAYSLVGEEFRFSRVMILTGSLWAMVLLPACRYLLSRPGFGVELDTRRAKRVAIIGELPEAGRIRDLLALSPASLAIVGTVSPGPGETGEDHLGTLPRLREIIRIHRIDEIIFCAGSLGSGDIIRAMLDLTELDVDYKIAPPESLGIIGSNSIHTAGELYLVNINAISRPENQRAKRSFDFVVSLVLLFFCWILVWMVTHKKQFLKNCFLVLGGKASWVGYIPGDPQQENLPAIRPGVLHPGMAFPGALSDLTRVSRLNLLYAKDYRIRNDLGLLLRNLHKLDSHRHE